MTLASRREFLTVGGSALLSVIAGCSGSSGSEVSTGNPSTTSASDTQITPWHFPHRTGSRSNATPALAPEDDIEAEWTVATERRDPSVGIAPLVTSDAVYGVTHNAVIGASRSDGSQQFVAENDTARSAFIHDGGIISRPNEGTQILGLKTSDGTRAWLSSLPEASSNEYRRLRLYPVSDRVIYSAQFETEEDGSGTEFGAISPGDQSQLWRNRVRTERGETIIRGVVADPDGDRVFVTRVPLNKFERPKEEEHPTIEAYDIESGDRRWSVETYGLPLAAHDGRLFVATPTNNILSGMKPMGLGALGTERGETLWTHEKEWLKVINIMVDNRAAVDDSGLYVSREKSLACLDPSTGSIQWEYPTTGSVYTAPVAAANAIVVGTQQQIHIVSKSDGSQLTKSTIEYDRNEGRITGNLSVVDETIYAGTREGIQAYTTA